MSVDDPRKVLQSIHEALNRKDVDKAVSFVADDVVAVTPEGTYKGKAENKRYFDRSVNQMELKLVETGIYAEGNIVTHEYVMEGTYKDRRMSVPAVTVAEVKDGKAQRVHTYYDRLEVARQMAKGLIATRTINSIISQMEKGPR